MHGLRISCSAHAQDEAGDMNVAPRSNTGHVPTFCVLYVFCPFMIVPIIGARSADNWYVPIIGNLRYIGKLSRGKFRTVFIDLLCSMKFYSLIRLYSHVIFLSNGSYGLYSLLNTYVLTQLYYLPSCVLYCLLL